MCHVWYSVMLHEISLHVEDSEIMRASIIPGHSLYFSMTGNAKRSLKMSLIILFLIKESHIKPTTYYNIEPILILYNKIIEHS